MAEIKPTNESSDRELVVSRVFDAPRELVFQVWTEPEQVAQWWGPTGFTTTTHEMDVRPGGVWRFIMHSPDGVNFDNRIVYREVVRPERLVYVHDSDRDDDLGQFEVTVTFAEQGHQTHLTMRSRFRSAEELNRVVKEYGALEGAHQTLARLADYLAALQSTRR